MPRFPTLHGTIRDAEALIAAGDLGAALEAIEAQVVSWSAMPALTQNALWGSRELDRLVSRIGKLVSHDAPVPLDVRVPPSDRAVARDVYLFTWAASGGHVRVGGDLIRSATEREAIVVLTEQRTAVDAELFEAVATPPERVIVLPELPQRARTRALIGLLEQLRPDRLFLLNHHHDCSIIAAAQPAAARQIIYVHHGDFSPALGVFHPTAVHLDVTPRLYSFCRSVLGLRNKFAPLAAPDLGARSIVDRGKITQPVLATCGSSIKYDLSYRLPYHKVVAELLAETGAKLYHIGELRPDQLAEIRAELRARAVGEDRWVHIPAVRSVWRSLAELNVDLYINSFPQRGARVAVEVMGSGTPAVWHLGGTRNADVDLNLAYPEALSWRDAGELIEIVSNLDGDWIRRQARAARAHYERSHAPRVLEQLVASDFDAVVGCSPSPHRCFAYEFDHLEESWHRLAARAERESEARPRDDSAPSRAGSSYFPSLRRFCEHFGLSTDELLKPSTSHAAVIKTLIVNALHGVEIDVDKYAQQNPDLVFAFGDNLAEIARHFRTQGYFEGRPFPVSDFDAEYYSAANPDVLAGRERWEPRDLEAHYLQEGMASFRPPNRSSAQSAADWKNALSPATDR